MPRRGRRSEAAKLRWRRVDPEQDIPKTCPMVCQEESCGPSTALGSAHGKGYRHRATQWGYSRVTRRRCKFVLLAEAPEKKFALLVGDSHLRAIVDGFVTMPGSTFSLGVLSSPGASADDLRREVLDVTLPRTPDVICLLAPSNNLSSSRTFQEAGQDFDSLLHTISNLCANVVVLDFPPRLVVEERDQALLRQQYSRVAAKRNSEEHEDMEFAIEDFVVRISLSPHKDPLLQLVSLQKASGCWLLDADLAAALGKASEEVEKAKPGSVSSEVWASILALIWLHCFKMDAKEEWELLAQKAAAWIKAQNAACVSECVKVGNKLLGCSVKKENLGI